jgi:carbon monoxide dehydrogenase subunit G
VKFENTFTVQAPVEQVWTALMDIERVAPAMPGAEVLERTGENAYRVGVKVKLGPMSLLYRGQVEIVEEDEAAKQAVMRAKATEARGQGMANAEVRMSLAETPDGTDATIATDLALSGRAASMGAGVISDVAGALVEEFASNLASMLTADGGLRPGASTAPPAASAPPAPATPPPPPPATASAPPPPATSSPPPPATTWPLPTASAGASLPVGKIAAGVIAKRLSNPRTLLIATVTFAIIFIAIGFAIGRAT